jgi:hypothetical protein
MIPRSTGTGRRTVFKEDETLHSGARVAAGLALQGEEAADGDDETEQWITDTGLSTQ